MKTVMTLALVAILAVALMGAPAFGQTAAYLQAKNGLALVETPGGTGSGFAVSPTLVATACHVIKGAAAIQINFWAAKVRTSGRQVLCDEKHDIGFIATPVPEGSLILQFAQAPPAQGDPIWVWGYPLGTDIALEPSVSRGGVSATETPQGFIALDVSGAPGNSGGPVVNDDGKVVGILVGSWMVESKQGQTQTGFKYASPGTVAATLMPDAASAAARYLGGTMVARVEKASIRPGEGIGGVKIGMTVAQAQEALGLPPTAHTAGWYTWQTRKLIVFFDNGRATLIGTMSTDDVTPEGIRVRSTDVDLIMAYGRPVCSSLLSYEGSAHLAWVYDGLFVLLDGSPRQIFAVVVIPNGWASNLCR